MGKKKNYKLYFNVSLVILIISIAVHVTAYFTNVLYLPTWFLWMVGIALFVVTFFDMKNATSRERDRVFTKKAFKDAAFVFLVAAFIYIVFNLACNISEIYGVSDLLTEDGVYYAVLSSGAKREITYAEYVNYELAGFRILSGHLIFFPAVSVWYYKLRKNGE